MTNPITSTEPMNKTMPHELEPCHQTKEDLFAESNWRNQVECPANKLHWKQSRYIWDHLQKCPDFQKNRDKFYVCFYNNKHIGPVNELQSHLQTCDAKKTLDIRLDAQKDVLAKIDKSTQGGWGVVDKSEKITVQPMNDTNLKSQEVNERKWVYAIAGIAIGGIIQQGLKSILSKE